MSQENVEIVREAHRSFDATGAPMWDRIDSNTEIFDHDILDAGTYRGREGLARWLSDYAESWGHYELHLERVIDAGAKVVSLFRIRAVGAGSGVPVERDDAMVWTFHDGMLLRLDYFNDPAQALEAAGLSS
jgi:ketosteroid isomerase-like protein